MRPIPEAAAGEAGATQPTDIDPVTEGRRSVWQTPFMQNVVPFLSSLGFHAVVLAVAVIAARVIIAQVSPRHVVELNQTEIAEGDLKTGMPEGMVTMGPPADPTRNFQQDHDPDVGQQVGIADRKGLSDALTKAGGSFGTDGAATELIGIGASGKGRGVAFGMGDGLGSGLGQDGQLAAFGPAGGGGGGLRPGTGIFGPSSGAKRVAFVCDASGSMISKMATLKDELGKAVNNLRPYQSFNVIFFKDVQFAALDSESLTRATPDAKRKAFQFLDNVSCSGTTNPIAGIELALKQKPQLIYLLTDGDFEDNAAVLHRITELNRDHAVQINTIAFVNDADQEQNFLDLLQKIAEQNSGKYRYVRESELSQ